MLAGFFTCLQTPGTARAELAAESKNRVPDRQKNTAEKTFRQERFLHAAYNKHRKLSICASTGSSAASGDKRVQELRLDQIRRPLQGTRTNDPEKVKQLADSIAEIGLQEAIDVLEVEGKYYGFSGCHRYESGGIAEAILKDAPFTAQGNALQTLTIDGGTTGASAAWQGDDTLQG